MKNIENYVPMKIFVSKALSASTARVLGNGIEQDHRFIKKKCKPMLGLFSFKSARATLAGIELHHMLRTGQYKFKSHLPIWEQLE
jgi:putative transposase